MSPTPPSLTVGTSISKSRPSVKIGTYMTLFVSIIQIPFFVLLVIELQCSSLFTGASDSLRFQQRLKGQGSDPSRDKDH